MEFKFDINHNLHIVDDNQLIPINEHYLTADDIGLYYTSNLLKQLVETKCKSEFLIKSTCSALCYRIKQYKTAIEIQCALDHLDNLIGTINWFNFSDLYKNKDKYHVILTETPRTIMIGKPWYEGHWDWELEYCLLEVFEIEYYSGKFIFGNNIIINTTDYYLDQFIDYPINKKYLKKDWKFSEDLHNSIVFNNLLYSLIYELEKIDCEYIDVNIVIPDLLAMIVEDENENDYSFWPEDFPPQSEL